MTIRRVLLPTLAAAAAVCAIAIAELAFAAGPVKIHGNHPADIASLADATHADGGAQLTLNVVLGLHNQAALEKLLAAQQDPTSPKYHQWLSAAEFNRHFGPTAAQIDTVKKWLADAGFSIAKVDQRSRTITAQGSVATAEAAFATEIVTNGSNFGNTSDPSVPAELTGLIADIQGLDNMHAVAPAGLHRTGSIRPAVVHSPNEVVLALADATDPSASEPPASPGVSFDGSTAFGPFDIETFYNEAPLISAGDSGTGSPDCIALAEDSDYLDAALALFDSSFGFPAMNLTRVLPGVTSPGTNGDETEALLDIDYAHATAPATPIHVYVDASLETSITSAITGNVCGAVSVSFIFCSSTNSFFTGLDGYFSEAAAQGQSVFVSSGDWGAAGLQYDSTSNSCVTGTVLNPSEMAGSPHVTAVGGTQFSPQYNGSSNDTSVIGVAPGGIETAWSSSGGGVSNVFAKPSWQTGTLNDSKRDIPDVSMIAWSPGVFIGADSSGTAIIQCCWGGTSLSAPLWAGYTRVIASKVGTARLGLINPTLYPLANAGAAANGLVDVTSGNNSFNGVTGYNAGPGYDLVTGWGSPDMTKFANAYAGSPQASPTATATPTVTPTKTATATRTPTPTATATPTIARTPTPTATATHTAIKTPTPTPTKGGKPTRTPAPTRTPTPTATGTPTLNLNVSPTSVNFGRVKTGHTSSSVTITLSNPASGSTQTISSVALATGTQFSISSNTCTAGKQLTPGTSCTTSVSFHPTSSGTKSDTLSFIDTAANSPQTVSLSGSN
jgi:subtilase family serine protease